MINKSNILGHIVGIDDIHKKKLIRTLPSNIKAIDLDSIQQQIYNHKNIIKQKMKWGQITSDIIRMRKQNKLSGSKKNCKQRIPKKRIKQQLLKRANIKRTIHTLWKKMMEKEISEQLSKDMYKSVLFIGHNMFPKDYRVKVNLNIPSRPSLGNMESLNMESLNMERINSNISSNLIIYRMKPELYAANQIKFYLSAYANRIIRGSFPINLLQTTYLSNKYQKVTNYYSKLDYQFINEDNIYNVISTLISDREHHTYAQNHYLYVVTLYKTNGIIPINKKSPLEVFRTKAEAINATRHIMSRHKYNKPVYIHKIKSLPIVTMNNKLYAGEGVIYPIEEESVLLT